MTCPTCGKTHRRNSPLCRRCATDAANTLELTGGQWRYDPQSHVRRWVRDLVAQTFDEGHIQAGISGRIGSENDGPTGAFAHSNRAYPLNELAESRIDE
jgi:hypothetical protein